MKGLSTVELAGILDITNAFELKELIRTGYKNISGGYVDCRVTGWNKQVIYLTLYSGINGESDTHKQEALVMNRNTGKIITRKEYQNNDWRI